MIVTKSILLAYLLHRAGARNLSSVVKNAEVGEQIYSTRTRNINRALKKAAKQDKDPEFTLPKEPTKLELGAKGAKSIVVDVSTNQPSESTHSPPPSPDHPSEFDSPSPTPELAVPVEQDNGVPATSLPSPWPTYYPIEVSTEVPTEFRVGLEFELVVGPPRTPDCPPLVGQPIQTLRPTERPVQTLRPTPLPIQTSPPTERPIQTPPPTPRPIQTSRPTERPIQTPRPLAMVPTSSSQITFRRGDLKKDITRFGFKVNRGIYVRQIARANKYVRFDNGKLSDIKYHAMPDGAAVIPLNDGYVYVNNAEINDGRGGVYGLYFDKNGNIVDYKELLSGRSRSCSGGTTPWNTYVSCEEVKDGRCWQVDPDPSSKYHTRPEATMLGSGYFEAIACDDRDPARPVFYVLEDVKLGALRKYTPPPSNNGSPADWTTLHTPGGTTEFLLFIDDKTFTWTACDEKAARLSQEAHFPNPEGVDIKDGIMYFVSKKTYKLYILDLDRGTYTTVWTNSTLSGDGEFGNSPDQIVRNNKGDFLYFTEDGGSTPGVYALDPNGSMHAIIEAYDDIYKGDETTGLAFSPDGTTMYAAFQDCGCAVTYADDCGCLFQFIRADGFSFDDESL